MYTLFRWLINALAMLGIAYLVPGFGVESFFAALIAALVLGLVNALLRPILLILTFPITVVTLGLFVFVVNALMVWLVSTLVPGFVVDGFIPALLVALLLWAVSVATNMLVDAAKKS